MKRPATAVIALAMGLAGGWCLAQLSWTVRIDGRAFVCSDEIGFSAFHSPLGHHMTAGDPLGEGWTWLMIRQEQKGHLLLFGASSLAISCLGYRAMRGRATTARADGMPRSSFSRTGPR